MRVQGNTARKSDRQSWQHLAANTKANPMHRAMALAHMRLSKAAALNQKYVQIMHDA